MNLFQYCFILNISNYFRFTYSISKDVSSFIGCLFALESDYGRNTLSKCYHNFCSMKVPFVRLSRCENFGDSNFTWAHYKTVYDCYDDFALWIQYQKPVRKQLESIDLFIPLLRSYCPEKDYISKIQSIYQQFKSFKNE